MRRPQFSIRWLMQLVAIAAGFFWIALTFGFTTFSCLVVYFTVIGVLSLGPWFLTRKHRRFAALTFAVTATLEFVFLAGLAASSDRSLGIVSSLTISLVLLPFVYGAGFAWAQLTTSLGAMASTFRTSPDDATYSTSHVQQATPGEPPE